MNAHSPSRWRLKRPSVIPGFGLALGLTLTWLTLLILIPLSGLAWRSSELGWEKFLSIALDPRTVNALRISFGGAFIAACINAVLDRKSVV